MHDADAARDFTVRSIAFVVAGAAFNCDGARAGRLHGIPPRAGSENQLGSITHGRRDRVLLLDCGLLREYDLVA